MTEYTCLDCGTKCVGNDARKAHYGETKHGAYESPVRKLPLSEFQRENIEKHGVPIWTVAMQDGSVLKLFAETATGIKNYSRYNDTDGKALKEEAQHALGEA